MTLFWHALFVRFSSHENFSAEPHLSKKCHKKLSHNLRSIKCTWKYSTIMFREKVERTDQFRTNLARVRDIIKLWSVFKIWLFKADRLAWVKSPWRELEAQGRDLCSHGVMSLSNGSNQIKEIYNARNQGQPLFSRGNFRSLLIDDFILTYN